jgi:7-carboxy-7-deazaguanine synthase
METNSNNNNVILLPVVETFYSIQGEGLNTGKPAFFIRLGGCDVCCTWCDEKIAWDENLYPRIHPDILIEEVLKSGAGTVVVTGGEPFRHNLEYLSMNLQRLNIICMAETSGTAFISGTWDWITVSPKQQQPPLPNSFVVARELKVVIAKAEDFIWAEKNASAVQTDVVLYLQPEWSCFDEILPLIVRYVKDNPKWRLSVQVHKFLNIP